MDSRRVLSVERSSGAFCFSMFATPAMGNIGIERCGGNLRSSQEGNHEGSRHRLSPIYKVSSSLYFTLTHQVPVDRYVLALFLFLKFCWNNTCTFERISDEKERVFL